MLAPGEQDLFWFLSCLEESDRIRLFIEANWPGLWRRLNRDGQPPDIDQVLAAITARGLASVRSDRQGDPCYPVHPGIAEAGRGHAGLPFRDAVDAEAAVFWIAAHEYATGHAEGGSVNTRLLVRAGMASVPYLLRQQNWNQAGNLLQTTITWDQSRATAMAVLPAIQQIADHQPRWGIMLGKVLEVIDPVSANLTLRTAMTAAASCGDYKDAVAAAGQLIDLCQGDGRLAEALDLIEQKADYGRQAGLDPWTQLSNEVQRLQVLAAMGHARKVLNEVTRLSDHMSMLPATHGSDENLIPWSIREVVFDVGYSVAVQLGQYDDALALMTNQVDSMRARAAPATEIAGARFNYYGPLLRLGRIEEALRVLLSCREVFQDANDTRMLGKTLAALAHVEDLRGRGDAALRLQRDALRYNYAAGDTADIAVSYNNLGNYLARDTRQPAQSVANHLTADLICFLTQASPAGSPCGTRSRTCVTSAPPPSRPPASRSCAARFGDIPGTDLPALLTAISPDPDTTEQALRDLIATVKKLAAAPPPPALHLACARSA